MKTNRILCISLLCAAIAGNVLFTSCSKEKKKQDPETPSAQGDWKATNLHLQIMAAKYDVNLQDKNQRLATLKPLFVLVDQTFVPATAAQVKDLFGVLTNLSGSVTYHLQAEGKVLIDIPGKNEPITGTWAETGEEVTIKLDNPVLPKELTEGNAGIVSSLLFVKDLKLAKSEGKLLHKFTLGNVLQPLIDAWSKAPDGETPEQKEVREGQVAKLKTFNQVASKSPIIITLAR